MERNLQLSKKEKMKLSEDYLEESSSICKKMAKIISEAVPLSLTIDRKTGIITREYSEKVEMRIHQCYAELECLNNKHFQRMTLKR